MAKLVTCISGVVIAMTAIAMLWLNHSTTPELPPLKPLTEPTYNYTPPTTQTELLETETIK